MTKSIRRPIVGIMAATALSSFGGAASAEVRYEFTALDSQFDYTTIDYLMAESWARRPDWLKMALPPLPLKGHDSGNFSVLLPDFVTTNTTLPLDSLTECSYARVGYECGDHRLITEFVSSFVVLGREKSRLDMVGFNVGRSSSGGYTRFFHFEDGALGKPGVYETLAGSFAGRLVVSVVPEPSQWMMLLLGLAGVGVARWRRAWQA